MQTIDVGMLVTKAQQVLRIVAVVAFVSLMLYLFRGVIIVGAIAAILFVLVAATMLFLRLRSDARAVAEVANEAETFLGQTNVRLMRPDEVRPEMLGGTIITIVPGQDVITTTPEPTAQTAAPRYREAEAVAV